MPIDDQQVETIAVNLLTPQVTRLLTMCAASLATVGVTVNVGQGSAGQIASALVGLAIVIWHEFSAIKMAKANAQSAYQQGAAFAGVTVPDVLVPKVISGTANATPMGGSVTQSLLAAPSAPSPLKPTVDSSGNVKLPPQA